MGTKNTYSTIVLKGNLDKAFDSAYAGGALLPGYLCKLTNTNTLVVHPTASGFHEAIVATEDDHQGKTVDQAYASLDEVPYHICQPGDEVALWLSNSQTIAIDDPLISAGDGKVSEGDGADEYVLFRAMEAVTTTGAAKQIRARYVGPKYVKA